MRRRAPEELTFRDDATTAVVAVMEELMRSAGWLILQPGFDEDELPPGRATARALRARPSIVPVCSWVPGERTRAGVDYTALGIEHAAGRDAAALVDVPERWHVVQDNRRRGLVVAVPSADPRGEVLAWLLRAGRTLCGVPLTGEWRAVVHRR